MSYEPSPADTQPRSPFKGREIQPPTTTHAPPESVSGPGCALYGCFSLIGLGFAAVIVLLAAAAGWTSGKRIAETNATATQNVVINEQVSRLPAELGNCNLALVNVRLGWLLNVAPTLAAPLVPSATAAYANCQPTAVPTPTPTLPPQATEAATEEPISLPADEDGGYDLAALLQEAETDVAAGMFEDAYDLLDVITAVDSTYEAARVRQLTTTALNGQARALFNTNQPAAAIVWASRAETLGVLEGDLSFELYAAQNYLNAKAAIGLNATQAIGALREVYSLGPGRYYEEARILLIQQYVRYGDALIQDQTQGACPAASQYQEAVNLGADASVIAKRDAAQESCSQATPVGAAPGTAQTPGAPPSNGQIAPVGQQ